MFPIAVLVLAASRLAAQPSSHPMTVDDLMRLRTVVDVKISPDGRNVAYVVSTPSVERNAHEPELFVVPSAGGAAVRLASAVRIFTPTLPVPRLR